jgi:hypothetical protein
MEISLQAKKEEKSLLNCNSFLFDLNKLEESDSVYFELKYEKNTVRILKGQKGELWFVASDIASLLGYSNTDKAVRTHIKNDKHKMIFRDFELPPKLGGRLEIDPRQKEKEIARYFYFLMNIVYISTIQKSEYLFCIYNRYIFISRWKNFHSLEKN